MSVNANAGARARLTDQAAVAVAVARTVADTPRATVAHLLVGLATEPEGRAGRRLRERASAAARLCERAAGHPAPPLFDAVRVAVERSKPRAAGTVDLLDAAIAEGGDEVADLLTSSGYHRDLDGWLAQDPADDWFEDAETYGFHPHGEATLDRSASRVVAQVRAVAGGAIAVLIAGIAAPDGPPGPDPRRMASVANRLDAATVTWDAGLDAVVAAASTLGDGPVVTVRDLVRAALVAGGDGPPVVLELATGAP